jgi:hypothetical protein
LVHLLTSKDYDIRIAVIEALASIGGTEARKALERESKNPAHVVKQEWGNGYMVETTGLEPKIIKAAKDALKKMGNN